MIGQIKKIFLAACIVSTFSNSVLAKKGPSTFIQKSKNSQIILIHFKEDANDQVIKSKIKKIKEQYHINLFPLFKQDLTKILRKINFFETYEKKNYFDPRRIYKFYWPQSSNPKPIIEKLQKEKLIDRVYVYPQGKLSSIETVPDLSSSQTYLEDFHIHFAHEQNNFGQGTSTINFEYNWNENHLDLELGLNSFINRPFCHENRQNPHCPLWTAHGTAVAGLIKGKNNQYGILGVSPETNLKLYSLRNHNLAEALMDVLYQVEEGLLQAGATLLIQSQYQGAQANFLFDDSRGYLPAEVIPIHFELFELLSAFGLIVIEAAGNGYVNLDDTDNYLPFHINLSENQSPAIMVAASNSDINLKTDFTNCGNRIDLLAPGLNLMSTSYPTNNQNLEWINNNLPQLENNDENNYFINTFSGTSASSSIIAGMVGLLQSKIKNRLGVNRSLMPLKIKEILLNSGEEIPDECRFGRKTDLEIALIQLDEFIEDLYRTFPEIMNFHSLDKDRFRQLRAVGLGMVCIEHNNAASDPLCPEELIWPSDIETGKKMDLDGDQRADIIEISSDNPVVRIDFSSIGNSLDRFGSWDLVFPYNYNTYTYQTHDFNNDGRTDFFNFHKSFSERDHKLFINLTTRDKLRNGFNLNINSNNFDNWDQVIEYQNPDEVAYVSTIIGDFNGDTWQDFSIIDQNGFWKVDFNNEGNFDGIWDIQRQILNQGILNHFENHGFVFSIFSGKFRESDYDQLAYFEPSLINNGSYKLVILEGPDYNQSWQDAQISPLIQYDEPIFFALSGRLNDLDDYDDILIEPLETVFEANFSYLLSHNLFSEQVPSPLNLVNNNNFLAIKDLADYDGDGIEDVLYIFRHETYIYYSSPLYNELKDGSGARHLNMYFNNEIFFVGNYAY